MGKYIEWDLENNPQFFRKPQSGKYVDTGILWHVICNVNRPESVSEADFMAVLNAVAEEMNEIPAMNMDDGNTSGGKNTKRMVPLPCKVGDVVYQTDGVRIYKSQIKRILFDADSITFDDRAIGTSIFLTPEDAEAERKRLC